MTRSPKPSDCRPRPIGPLAVLPLFHKLDGRRVLAVGASEAMAWKLDLLEAAGARAVVAPANSAEDTATLASTRNIDVVELDTALSAIGAYALVVADVEDEFLARRIFDTATNAGVPVNQIDRPAFCTVQFGSIVNRSPVVLGISTDGAAPVLGQAIRTRIETLLPGALGSWAERARALRSQIAQEIELAALRRAWWGRYANHALNAQQAPDAEPPHFGSDEASQGRVTLVGAGPGDPDLLTVKALRALQDADIVLYDALVSDEVLELARREARRMPVGKRAGRRSCKQEEINRLMIRFAEEGLHVVRLKAGDPAIFSRGAEEIDALALRNIPVSVVPGITSASSAAAGLGLTLTDRTRGRQVLFASGHGRNGELPAIDWPAIASGTTTIGLYMGRSRLAAFAREALAHGASPNLPVSIGTNISRHDEEWDHRTLSTATNNVGLRTDDQPRPALILIGNILRDCSPDTISPAEEVLLASA